jgi:hypothetical protein
MYTLPKPGYLRRSVAVGSRRPAPIAPLKHEQRIKQELRELGVSRYGLLKLESRFLPRIIHKGEHIMGVVYGSHQEGSVMIVATDRRIIVLDKKPLFVNEDEISYVVVGGVSFSHAGLGTTVTLHTRTKDYTVQTLNQQCARGFVEYIERRCLEHNESAGMDYILY